MRWQARILICMAMICGAAVGAAQTKADALVPSVVYLQRSARFRLPVDARANEGILLREMARQALLIAAGDELGLATRDVWLGDVMPADGDNAPFEVATDPSRSVPTLVVRRGFAPGGQLLLSIAPTLSLIPPQGQIRAKNMLDYVAMLAQMEKFSRNQFIGVLRQQGFQGPAHPWRPDGAVPAAIEEDLSHMRITSQYSAVRQLHELIRTQGESPARLGALVRGYANLGMLTEFYWHPMHKVFKARALLYAQRMLARDENSLVARSHRAYALTLAGCHSLAIRDINAVWETARKAGSARDKEIPVWVDLLDATCRFELQKLATAKMPKPYTELAALLHFSATALTNDAASTIKAGLETVQSMPECYTVHNRLCRAHQIGLGHAATTQWIGIAGATLYRRVAALPELPKSVAAVTGSAVAVPAESATDDEVQSLDKEFARRGELIRALRNVDRPVRGGRLHDRGEPSWACLGLLIRELSFVQVFQRMIFEESGLDVPTEAFLKTAAPLLADHPYRAFIEQHTNVAKAVKNVPSPERDALEQQEWSMADWHQRIRRSGIEIDTIVHGLDATVVDTSWPLTWRAHFPTEYEIMDAIAVSPLSPQARAKAVEMGIGALAPLLPGWQRTADRYPVLTRAFIVRAQHMGHDSEAITLLKNAVARWHNLDDYDSLAAAYQKAKQPELWRATLEESLRCTDYGLHHASVESQLARYYMAFKQWDKATSWAEKSAGCGSEWGILTAAECHEAQQDWNSADDEYRAVAQRYPESCLNWYCYSRRTGHGDAAAAGKACKDLRDSTRHERIGGSDWLPPAFYMLEKEPKQAIAQIVATGFGTKTLGHLHTALLSDQLHDSATRDSALARAAGKPPGRNPDARPNQGKKKPKNKKGKHGQRKGPKPKPADEDADKPSDAIYPYEGNQRCLAQLAGMLADDLAKGGKGAIDLQRVESLLARVATPSESLNPCGIDEEPERNLKLPVYYIVGKYLDLHGKREQAVECWKKCMAETEVIRDMHRTLAGAELVGHGVKPEAYRSLVVPKPVDVTK